MAKLKVLIKRENGFEEFEYDGDLNITVTTLIERINAIETSNPIKWSCSCLQGLCGSCAMVINSVPKLACKTFVNQEIMTKEFGRITLEPLSKFPVVKDLKVDRSKLYENMERMSLWLDGSAEINQKDVDFEYEMSLCLMCGCCLEACPNYTGNDSFVGTPIAVSAAKLTSQESDKNHLKDIKKNYKDNFYPTCVKALACEDVCPMKIPTQRAISNMNRKSVWRLWHLFDR